MINFAKDIEDMEQKQITATYAEAVKAIKEAILESRYRAARLVNKEVLALYYAIGGYISAQSRAARWGSNAIGTISELLQQELPGLRGFSETSIKRMRIFYEAWCILILFLKPVAYIENHLNSWEIVSPIFISELI